MESIAGFERWESRKTSLASCPLQGVAACNYLSHSLNSLEEGYIGDYIGEYYGG